MWVRKGDLSLCLSVCQVESCAQDHLWCLISGSVPSQLDEEEERRKRRREKNKVAAARCRNKKKERTEFLQRVSERLRWGGALSFAGADVPRSQGQPPTLYNAEKVEGPMLSSTEPRSRVLIDPVAHTWKYPCWSLVTTTVF